MNGYSKMRVRSMDLSSHNTTTTFSSPPPPPPLREGFDGKSHGEEGIGGGGVVLRRNLSSSASQRFRGRSEKSMTAVGSLVRRAFSMRSCSCRSSSSFGDGYWRIHDNEEGEVIHEDEEEERKSLPIKKKKTKNIFKAWKSLFKFH